MVWEVELFSFDRTAHATRLSGRELLQRGLQLKSQGNTVFKQVHLLPNAAGCRFTGCPLRCSIHSLHQNVSSFLEILFDLWLYTFS